MSICVILQHRTFQSRTGILGTRDHPPLEAWAKTHGTEDAEHAEEEGYAGEAKKP